MFLSVLTGLLIPFFGTTLGAAFIFLLKRELCPRAEQLMLGFAAGVMTAASVWSLLIPAIELESGLGVWSFLPAAAGFVIGILFPAAADWIAGRICPREDCVLTGSEAGRKQKRNLNRYSLMVLAVTIHNIPEGLSVGAAFAGMMTDSAGITAASAFALAVGVGVQNLPEGFIVALPFRGKGESRRKAFGYGVLSGAVEPLSGAVMVLLAAWLSPVLPWLLAFSAGAMFCVILEELIPEAEKERKMHLGTAGFAAGFLLMMILDVALG